MDKYAWGPIHMNLLGYNPNHMHMNPHYTCSYCPIHMNLLGYNPNQQTPQQSLDRGCCVLERWGQRILKWCFFMKIDYEEP
jgi:hypothetical protein